MIVPLEKIRASNQDHAPIPTYLPNYSARKHKTPLLSQTASPKPLLPIKFFFSFLFSFPLFLGQFLHPRATHSAIARVRANKKRAGTATFCHHLHTNIS